MRLCETESWQLAFQTDKMCIRTVICQYQVFKFPCLNWLFLSSSLLCRVLLCPNHQPCLNFDAVIIKSWSCGADILLATLLNISIQLFYELDHACIFNAAWNSEVAQIAEISEWLTMNRHVSTVMKKCWLHFFYIFWITWYFTDSLFHHMHMTNSFGAFHLSPYQLGYSGHPVALSWLLY